MSTPTLSENNLAALADALADPVRVAAAREEQRRRRELESTRARDEAIENMQSALVLQSTEKQLLDAALERLQAARAAAESLQHEVAIADSNHRDASNKVQAAHRSVQSLHGGSAVDAGLMRLHQAVEAQQKEVAALEANRYETSYHHDGVSIIWRRSRPEVEVKIEPANQLLGDLKAAFAAVQSLNEAKGRSPESIRREVEAALTRFNLLPSEASQAEAS